MTLPNSYPIDDFVVISIVVVVIGDGFLLPPPLLLTRQTRCQKSLKGVIDKVGGFNDKGDYYKPNELNFKGDINEFRGWHFAEMNFFPRVI